MCASVGGRELTQRLYHRNFGYDELPYNTGMILHPWTEAPTLEVPSDQCDLLRRHSEKSCLFYNGSGLIANKEWPIGVRGVELSLSVNVTNVQDTTAQGNDLR